MTIAIGLIAQDGLVLAADTQETIQGLWKNDQGKILSAGHSIIGPIPDVGYCAISGAGGGEYIDALARQMMERFLANPPVATHAEAQTAFAPVLEDFHAKHILPFGHYPRDDRPHLRLVIGCHFHLRGSMLFVTEENVLLPSGPYQAIGIGAMLAHTLLARLYRLPMLSVWETAMLASYVMYHVKDAIDGCGKSTDITIVGRHGQVWLRRQETELLEQAMREYSFDAEPEQFRWTLGADAPKRAATFGRSRRKLKRLVEKMRSTHERQSK